MPAVRAPLSGSLRKDGRWQVTLALTSVSGGKYRKSFYAPTQAGVRAKALAFMQANEERRPRPEMTVLQLMELAATERFAMLEQHTQDVYAYFRKDYIYPAVGTIKLKELKPHHVEAMMRGMATTCSKQTILHVRGHLRAALTWAVKNEWVSRNAAALAEPRAAFQGIDVKEGLAKPLISRDDLERVIAAEPRQVLRALYRFLGEVGKRPHKESARLLWTELVREDDGYWITIPRAKSKAGRLPVPLSDALANELLSLPKVSPFVFASESGDPFDASNLRRSWNAAQKAAGVVQCDVYSLRHLFARQKARTAKEHVLRRLMGHSDSRTTRQYYLDAERSELRESVTD